MHFTTAAASILATVLANGHGAAAAPSPCPTAPIEGPFYLTVVPTNGTEYPATVATVSRGAMILASSDTYAQQFTYDTASSRIFQQGEDTIGSGEVREGLPLLFTGDSGDWPLDQVVQDCAVYLVKGGASGDDVTAWWSKAGTEDLPVEIHWQGAGQERSIAAIRVDSQLPVAT